MEFFIKNNKFPKMINNFKTLKREVKIDNSKLDFLINNNLYLEVKTPLVTINVKYDKNIKIVPFSKFTSYDRLIKHIEKLTKLLENGNQAILAIVYQYKITNFKE